MIVKAYKTILKQNGLFTIICITTNILFSTVSSVSHLIF